MAVTLKYILPEELDMGSADVATTAERVYACQQHVDMLHQLKLEDLRSQVARPFRETYVDFRLSVNLKEMVSCSLLRRLPSQSCRPGVRVVCIP